MVNWVFYNPNKRLHHQFNLFKIKTALIWMAIWAVFFTVMFIWATGWQEVKQDLAGLLIGVVILSLLFGLIFAILQKGFQSLMAKFNIKFHWSLSPFKKWFKKIISILFKNFLYTAATIVCVLLAIYIGILIFKQIKPLSYKEKQLRCLELGSNQRAASCLQLIDR